MLQVDDSFCEEPDVLKRSVDSSDYQMSEVTDADKRGIDLQAEIQNLSATSDGQTKKLQDLHSHKLKSPESQIQDLKKKKDSQVPILKQKQKTDEEAKKFQNEI
ncbi:kinesin-like protein KIN-4A [Tanacetum coccineum]